MGQKQAPEEFFSLNQCAIYGHVTRQAIYNALRKGLKAEKRGNRWYIKRADYDEYRANKYNRDKCIFEGEPLFDAERGHYSIRQVALTLSESLGYHVDVQRLYYLVRSGQLKAFKRGAAWVICKEDAIAVLEKEKAYETDQRCFI